RRRWRTEGHVSAARAARPSRPGAELRPRCALRQRDLADAGQAGPARPRLSARPGPDAIFEKVDPPHVRRRRRPRGGRPMPGSVKVEHELAEAAARPREHVPRLVTSRDVMGEGVLDRIADFVNRLIGSMWLFVFVTTGIVVWLFAGNIVGFDRTPWPLLLTLLNL